MCFIEGLEYSGPRVPWLVLGVTSCFVARAAVLILCADAVRKGSFGVVT